MSTDEDITALQTLLRRAQQEITRLRQEHAVKDAKIHELEHNQVSGLRNGHPFHKNLAVAIEERMGHRVSQTILQGTHPAFYDAFGHRPIALTLVMFDLAYLGYWNIPGHEKGNLALKTFADCMNKNLGPTADLYHWGGDEFAMIVHGGAVETTSIVEPRLKHFRKKTILQDQHFDLHADFGVASLSEALWGLHQLRCISEDARTKDQRGQLTAIKQLMLKVADERATFCKAIERLGLLAELYNLPKRRLFNAYARYLLTGDIVTIANVRLIAKISDDQQQAIQIRQMVEARYYQRLHSNKETIQELSGLDGFDAAFENIAIRLAMRWWPFSPAPC